MCYAPFVSGSCMRPDHSDAAFRGVTEARQGLFRLGWWSRVRCASARGITVDDVGGEHHFSHEYIAPSPGPSQFLAFISRKQLVYPRKGIKSLLCRLESYKGVYPVPRHFLNMVDRQLVVWS